MQKYGVAGVVVVDLAIAKPKSGRCMKIFRFFCVFILLVLLLVFNPFIVP